MPITIDEIRRRLASAFPDGSIEIQDLTGGGDHFSAVIVSEAFQNLGPVDRHRKVYAALGDAMHADIHALALTTRTPAEAQPLTIRTERS